MKFVPAIIIVLSAVTAHSQPRKVTGRVVDEETQKGIAGATVTIADTDRKTITNQLGYFALSIEPADQSIIFSGVGFIDSKIAVPPINEFRAVVKREYLPLEGLDLGTFPFEQLDPIDSITTISSGGEQDAEYPGGWQYFYNEFFQLLKKKSNSNVVPDSTLRIRFTVPRNGVPADIRIPGSNDSLKIIIESTFRKLKPWQPARQNKFITAQHFELPLRWTKEVRPEDIMSASPVGGLEKFYEFVGKKIKYPAQARNNNITGKVYVGFFIEKDGSLVSARVVKGIGYGCDQEAIRVISMGTKWSPGTHKGQPMRQYFTLPISFSMDGVIAPADSRVFPKGYYEWMATNLRYPALAKRLGLEGTVLISFKVSKTGKIDSVQLLEDIGGNCGKEAIRVLKTVPREYSVLLESKGERLYQPLHFRVTDIIQGQDENNRPGVQVLWPIVITTVGGTARDPFGLMQGIAFRSFDEALARPRDVYRLDFARKNVTVVPAEIWRLEHLSVLDLEDNKVRSLPPEMGTLKKLAELHAPQNELKSLPIEFANLKALRTLGLANNKFEEFPKPVLLLTKLKTLDLSGNQMTSLPIGVGDLQNLETLLLHNNHLTSLPEQFYRLTQLKTLTISGNNLSDKDKQMLIERLKKTEIRVE